VDPISSQSVGVVSITGKVSPRISKIAA